MKAEDAIRLAIEDIEALGSDISAYARERVLALLRSGLPALTLVPLDPVTTPAAYAEAVIGEINRLTGRHFRAAVHVRRQAAALLKAKVTVDQALAVVRLRFEEWGGDPKMAKYVCPETLMRLSQVQKALAQIDAGPVRVRGATPTFKSFGEP